MSKKSRVSEHTMSPFVFRLVALAGIISGILLGVASSYFIWEYLLPIYGRIYRNAPLVKMPYLVFTMLMAPPIVLFMIIGGSIAAWTGKIFDPPTNSRMYRFQVLMMYLSVKTLIYVVPPLIILTIATLLYKDYSLCPTLRISGSARDLFWVNDERVCFKPTRYINDNWPCKMVGKQEVCIQVDGR